MAAREVLQDFIKEYEKHTCLWQCKSQDYHNKQKREAANSLLLSKLQLIDKNATKDTVLKKINALRTNYRKEKKKISQLKSPHAMDGNSISEASLFFSNFTA